MVILLTVIHVIVCLFLIVVVLLQSGKAADLAGAFGGMGSQTAFGPRGAATVLSKATTISAIVFMLTSISLGIVGSITGPTGQSVIERTGTPTGEAPAPGTVAPGTAPATAPAPVSPQIEVVPEGGGEGQTLQVQPLGGTATPGGTQVNPPAAKKEE
jgi:preprotein translocase subunit SecG